MPRNTTMIVKVKQQVMLGDGRLHRLKNYRSPEYAVVLCGISGMIAPFRRRSSECEDCERAVRWIRYIEAIRAAPPRPRKPTPRWELEDRNPIHEVDYRQIETRLANLLAQSRSAGVEMSIMLAAARKAGLEVIGDEILIPDEASFKRFRQELKALTFGQRYGMSPSGAFHVPAVTPAAYAAGSTIGFKPYSDGPSSWVLPHLAVLNSLDCTLYPVRPLDQVMTQAPRIAEKNPALGAQYPLKPDAMRAHLTPRKKATGGSDFGFQIPIDGEPHGALWCPGRGKSVPGPKRFVRKQLTGRLPKSDPVFIRAFATQARTEVEKLVARSSRDLHSDTVAYERGLRSALRLLDLTVTLLPPAKG